MSQPFDTAALNYDQEFTGSNIGRLLRAIVWQYLNRILPGSRKMNILELNCGTGEDAVYFGKKGHRVLATDISDEMLNVARMKVRGAGMEGLVDVQGMDIRSPENLLKDRAFDLVFSNFGGLNCLSAADLEILSDNLSGSLKPGGWFIAVVMGKHCLWESLYFLAKLDFHKAFRRNTEASLTVEVAGQKVETWYHDPSSFNMIFEKHFKKRRLIPLGFFLPPSYMETTMARRPGLLNTLDKLEKATSNAPLLAYFSDHYIIELVKR